MTRRGLISFVVLAGACAQPPQREPELEAAPPATIAPAPTPTPAVEAVVERAAVVSLRDAEAFVGKHVLVAAGTELRLAATPDAPRMELRSPGERDPFAFAFAVVDHRDGLLVLEPAAPESRCDPGLALGLDGVRLFVAPDALAPVLARESETRFDDGTWVRLRSGTAVVQDGPGGSVDVGGLRLHASVDPRDVGNAFVPAVAAAPPADTEPLAAAVALRYGQHELPVAAPLYLDASGRPVVLARTRSGDAELLDVVSGCASIRARVDPSGAPSRLRIEAPSSGMLLAMSGLDSWHVDAGAVATWSDGSPAGTLSHDHAFTRAGKRRKGRRCFSIGDEHTRFERLELCMPAKSVTHVDPMAMILGSSATLGALGGGSVFGSVDSGLESALLADALLGADIGEAYGVGGLGSVGTGRGGGGSIAIGGLGGIRGDAIADPEPSDTKDALAVELESLSTSGVRDGTSLRATIVAGAKGLASCAKDHSPVSTGVLALSFTITPSGAVRDLSLSGIDAISACARKAIGRWRFDAGGETTVDASISLQPPA